MTVYIFLKDEDRTDLLIKHLYKLHASNRSIAFYLNAGFHRIQELLGPQWQTEPIDHKYVRKQKNTPDMQRRLVGYPITWFDQSLP
jgi:hypothetical protein